MNKTQVKELFEFYHCFKKDVEVLFEERLFEYLEHKQIPLSEVCWELTITYSRWQLWHSRAGSTEQAISDLFERSSDWLVVYDYAPIDTELVLAPKRHADLYALMANRSRKLAQEMDATATLTMMEELLKQFYIKYHRTDPQDVKVKVSVGKAADPQKARSAPTLLRDELQRIWMFLECYVPKEGIENASTVDWLIIKEQE